MVKPTIKETFPSIWADLSLDSRVMLAIIEAAGIDLGSQPVDGRWARAIMIAMGIGVHHQDYGQEVMEAFKNTSKTDAYAVVIGAIEQVIESEPAGGSHA